MPKRTANYREGLLQRLTDPVEAANYLEAALEDSTEAFLVALRDVAESAQMAKVAKEAGVAREALYRMLSATGNPGFNNIKSILKSVGLRVEIAAVAKHDVVKSNDAPESLEVVPNRHNVASATVDATWKLNPALAGNIERWGTPVSATILVPHFLGNPFPTPALNSANSNPGGLVLTTNTHPGITHAGIEAGFQNVRK